MLFKNIQSFEDSENIPIQFFCHMLSEEFSKGPKRCFLPGSRDKPLKWLPACRGILRKNDLRRL